MKAKFDKDMLIKHRFWILLAVTIPLVLGAVFILITSVSAEIDSYRKKAVEKRKLAESAKVEYGPQAVDKLNEVAKVWKEGETSVHEIAWKAQSPLFTWPKAVEDRFDFQNGKFVTEVKIVPNPGNDNWPSDEDTLVHGFVKTPHEDYLIVARKDGSEVKFHRTFKMKLSRQQPKEGEREPLWGEIQAGNFVAITYYTSKYFYDQLTDSEQRAYVNSYKSQIHPILQIVDPVDAKGNGTVQFQGWLYQPDSYPGPKSKFFTYVHEAWQDNNWISEEAWMAQEDLWIQRELFRIIRAANDDVAVCKGEAVEGKKPAVFANPNFELKFEWEEDGRLMVTVKNMLTRRQKLDVQFRVKFNKSPNLDLSSEVFLLDGEPLDPKGTKKDSLTKEIPLEKGRIQRNGIYAVDQVLTWETAPVKRIDRVSIGFASGDIAHSHKTFPQNSQPYRKDPKKEEAGNAEANPMGGLGAQPMPMNLPGFGGGGQEGQQGQANFGVNGVLIDRYLEVSEQSRRLPVGMSLIVDQDHIGRVLTAFNNSKLRFLTTQVLLNRYPNSVRPQLGGAMADPFGGGANDDEAAPPPPMPMGGLRQGGGYTPPAGGSSLGPPKGFASSPKGIGPMPLAPPAPGKTGGYGVGPMAGSGAGAYLAGVEELESNVEVVIYGIVTVYERYPKRKVQVGDAK